MAGQVLLHLLVMICIVFALLAIRTNWQNNYEKTSFSAISASVKLFQIGENDSGEKQLLYKGNAYNAQQFSQNNELGVNGNTAFLGYLASVEQLIAQYNRKVRMQAQQLIAAMTRSSSALAAQKQYAISPSYFVVERASSNTNNNVEYQFIYFDFPLDKQAIPVNQSGILAIKHSIAAGYCLERSSVDSKWPSQLGESKNNDALLSLKKNCR